MEPIFKVKDTWIDSDDILVTITAIIPYTGGYSGKTSNKVYITKNGQGESTVWVDNMGVSDYGYFFKRLVSRAAYEEKERYNCIHSGHKWADTGLLFSFCTECDIDGEFNRDTGKYGMRQVRPIS